jgi:hypothetical protein
MIENVIDHIHLNDGNPRSIEVQAPDGYKIRNRSVKVVSGDKNDVTWDIEFIGGKISRKTAQDKAAKANIKLGVDGLGNASASGGFSHAVNGSREIENDEKTLRVTARLKGHGPLNNKYKAATVEVTLVCVPKLQAQPKSQKSRKEAQALLASDDNLPSDDELPHNPKSFGKKVAEKKDAESEELNIPKDNSCLFWALAIGALTPVLHHPDNYRIIFNKLFARNKEDEATLFDNFSYVLKERIIYFLENNDPSSLEKNGEDDLLYNLINYHLRQKIADHIESDQKTYNEEMLEKSNKKYVAALRSSDCWGGQIEIRAFFDMLDEDYSIRIQGMAGGNFEAPAALNRPFIELVYRSANGGRSGQRNHYNLMMPVRFQNFRMGDESNSHPLSRQRKETNRQQYQDSQPKLAESRHEVEALSDAAQKSQFRDDRFEADTDFARTLSIVTAKQEPLRDFIDITRRRGVPHDKAQSDLHRLTSLSDDMSLQYAKERRAEMAEALRQEDNRPTLRSENKCDSDSDSDSVESSSANTQTNAGGSMRFIQDRLHRSSDNQSDGLVSPLKAKGGDNGGPQVVQNETKIEENGMDHQNTVRINRASGIVAQGSHAVAGSHYEPGMFSARNPHLGGPAPGVRNSVDENHGVIAQGHAPYGYGSGGRDDAAERARQQRLAQLMQQRQSVDAEIAELQGGSRFPVPQQR